MPTQEDKNKIFNSFGGGWREGMGVVGAGEKLEAGYTFQLDCLVHLMSPRSASYRPRQDWRALRDVLLTQG